MVLVLASILVLASCQKAGSFAGPFVGTWRLHTFSLTVTQNGHGTFAWQVNCMGSVVAQPECQGSSPYIQPEHAAITLSSRRGETALGMITSSTDLSSVPTGEVTLRIGSNDLLYPVAHGRPAFPAYPYLCGEQVASLSISQQGQKNINCGA